MNEELKELKKRVNYLAGALCDEAEKLSKMSGDFQGSGSVYGEVDLEEIQADPRFSLERGYNGTTPGELTIYIEIPVPFHDEGTIYPELTVTRFLKRTRDSYACGDPGWGELMIADLEEFKQEIDKLITSTREEIENGN
jgi:hypothetical protein